MELAGTAAHMSPIVEESRHALVQLAPWIPDLPDESRTRLLRTCLANFAIHGGKVGMIYDLLLNELDHDGLSSDELDR